MNWKERLKEILMEARRQPFKRTPKRRGSGRTAQITKEKNQNIKDFKKGRGIPLKQRGHSEFQGPGPDAKPAGETMRNDFHYEPGRTEANQQADIEGKRRAAERNRIIRIRTGK